jgi:hypothetical protein
MIMWRITFALMSAIILTATFAASVLADSHEAAGTTTTTTTTAATGTTAAAPVTAVPRAGVGAMADQTSNLLLLGLVGIASLLALLAVTTMWQRQRA